MSNNGLFSFALQCIFLALYSQVDAQSARPTEQVIKETIFTKYDKIVKPTKISNAPVNVTLNPALFGFVSVDVAVQTMTFKQWFRMRWKDDYLTWNPAAYNGITSIMASRADVWLPDIMLLEATEISQLDDDKYAVIVQYDGTVSSSVDQLVTVHCQFDVTNFPYDTQNCTLRYTSWMYDAQNINPTPSYPTDLNAFQESEEWTLRNVSSRISQTQADGMLFIEVIYDVKITRKPGYYITSFILPAFIITVMSIIGVFTPYTDTGNRVEKVTFGLTALLTMAVVLMIVTSEMPKTSTGVPLLGIFILIEIFLIALATLIAVIHLHLHKSWLSNTQVPSCLLAFTCQPKPKIRAVRTASSYSSRVQSKEELIANAQKAVENAGLNVNLNDLNDEVLHEQWMRVTDRLDMIMMFFFLLLNVIATITFLLVGQSKLND